MTNKSKIIRVVLPIVVLAVAFFVLVYFPGIVRIAPAPVSFVLYAVALYALARKGFNISHVSFSKIIRAASYSILAVCGAFMILFQIRAHEIPFSAVAGFSIILFFQALVYKHVFQCSKPQAVRLSLSTVLLHVVCLSALNASVSAVLFLIP